MFTTIGDGTFKKIINQIYMCHNIQSEATWNR